MITDNRNFTRYETEDINNLLQELKNVAVEYEYTDWQKRQSKATFVPNVGNLTILRYVGLTELESAQQRDGWRSRRRTGVGRYSMITASGIKILNPLELAKFEELAYYTIANIENPVLPAPVVQEIIGLIVTLSANSRYSALPASVKDAVLASVDVTVRINPRSANPGTKRIKLTKEEKIERLKSDSFYGEGGKLEGPRWAWRSGSRAPTMKWTYRIREAKRFYEREKEARERHADALRALGVEPAPYESFSDFLRNYAAEIDRTEGGKQ